MPLLLLSKSNPLRWASIWDPFSRIPFFLSPVPCRSKLYIPCSDFFLNQSALMPLLLLSKSNPLRWASIWDPFSRIPFFLSPVPRRSKLYIPCSDFF